MKILPENAVQWGFSSEDISTLEELSRARISFLTEKDSRGRLLSAILNKYSSLSAGFTDFSSGVVRIGSEDELNGSGRILLDESLHSLQPWRKGPFNIFGISIDSEWRSDLKWNRFIDFIRPLKNRHILDIGSSNGYYMFRMAHHEPSMVMGIEPYSCFFFQFMLLNSFAGIKNIFTVPLRFEDTISIKKKFNTAFCMGILYHRRSPIDFLMQIRNMLTSDGELVLETLIIEEESHIALIPEDRYAKMPNIYFIPTINVLMSWLKYSGFRDSFCADISATTTDEQRKTPWVNTESLSDFLDSTDNTKTVEGYPAPVRAVIIAHP
jgi:tRNA (mo5U34)-methyltransferase